MRILSWNVNGIRSVYSKGFLDWLKAESPDILCVQETKAQPDQVPAELLDFDDYFSFWNSAQKKGYSGVGVFSKQEPLEVKDKLGFRDFDSEGRFLVLKYPKFTLVNVYMPQGGRTKEKIPFKLESYSFFLEFLDSFEKEEPILLCGDFNIAHTEVDLARPKQNQNNTMFTLGERKQIDAIAEKGFVDTFRKFHSEGGNYTWWPYFANARPRNIGWRIDYCFASKSLSESVKDAFILPKVMGSDHCPVGVELEDFNKNL